MRIGVFTQYFPSSGHPWQGQTAYQAVRLLAGRHDVRVFFPASVYPPLLRSLAQNANIADPSWQPEGVAVDYIPYIAIPVLTRPLNGFTMARTLLPAVARWRPEILLSYVAYPDSFGCVTVARALGVPSVVTAIGSDLNRIPDPLCARHTRWTLRHATRVVTVSDDLRRTAVALGAPPDRASAVLNGCDTSLFHPADRASARHALGVPADARAIVYVGRYDLRKGLAELLHAAAELLPTTPGLAVFLVGSGPDQPALASLRERLGLERTVHFIPAVVSAGVAEWIAASDLVTLPSYMEGCPNVVVEAVASGRPVVATRVGGIPELIDDTCGRLVPSHDAPALAAALRDVLTQPWNAEDIARRHSRSWADVAHDMEAVLRSALHSA